MTAFSDCGIADLADGPALDITFDAEHHEAKPPKVERNMDGLAGLNQLLLGFEFLDLFNCSRAVLRHISLFRDETRRYPAFSWLDGAAFAGDVGPTGSDGLLQGFVGRLQREHDLLDIK